VSREPAVVDTNVASFLYGGEPEAGLYEPDVKGRRLFLAPQTVAEMLHGGRLARWSAEERVRVPR